MKRIHSIALALLVTCLGAPAVTTRANARSNTAAQKQASRNQAAPANPDRLGLTCARILQMPSSDWVRKFTAANGATPESTIRAIAAYGKCYDARTNRLAASLGNSGKGPLMGARGNFGAFEQALQNFEAKALAAADPPADDVKRAYATLYEKQFRRSFYEDYVEHLDHRNIVSAAPEDAGDLGKAKNHFGELLGALPDDKMHEIHQSFGDILDKALVNRDRRLDLYRYAIFLLESPAEPPFSPPPF